MRATISGHSSLRKRLRSDAPSSPGTRRHEHANSAPDDYQALVLKTLVGLGDRQRVGLLLRGQCAHRRKCIPVSEFSSQDRVGDRLAETDIDGLFVLGSERHAVIIHRFAEISNENHLEFSGCHALRWAARARAALLQFAADMSDEDEARDPLSGLAEGARGLDRNRSANRSPNPRHSRARWRRAAGSCPRRHRTAPVPRPGSCGRRRARKSAPPAAPHNGRIRLPSGDGRSSRMDRARPEPAEVARRTRRADLRRQDEPPWKQLAMVRCASSDFQDASHLVGRRARPN